jgi:hypothetical protein
MRIHRLEHELLSVLGLMLGAFLAMCITPGDIVVPILAAITLAIFVHEFIKDNVEGGWHWPVAGSHAKKRVESQGAGGHR